MGATVCKLSDFQSLSKTVQNLLWHAQRLFILSINILSIACLSATSPVIADSSSTGLYTGVGAGRVTDGGKLSQRENAGFFYKTPWLEHVMIGVSLDWFNHNKVHVSSLEGAEATLGIEGEAVYIDLTSLDSDIVQTALRFGVGELRMTTIENDVQKRALSPYVAAGASVRASILGADFGRLNVVLDLHWLKAFQSVSDQNKAPSVLSITPMLSIQIFEIDKR